MDTSGKLGKLKSKLAEISSQIDEADQRKADAKTGLIEAQSRLEKGEAEVASIIRRKLLLQKGLDDLEERNQNLDDKLQKVEDNCSEIEEARKQLEENESAGDEKIQQLEEEVKDAKQKFEEIQTRLVEAERKKIVVGRDLKRTSAKADSLNERVNVLQSTIDTASESLKELEEREGESSMKEERNTEELLLLQGQLKEAEVRAEAAERSCATLEINIDEAKKDIETWRQKTDALDKEMNAMDNFELDDDDEEEE